LEKKEIIQQALDKLNAYLKVNLNSVSLEDYFSLRSPAQDESASDALMISNDDSGIQYRLFVQPWAPQKDIDALISQIKSSGTKTILFADFVNPVMAEKFRRRSIPFVDCAGNLFVRNEQFNFFEKRNKRTLLQKARVRGRAFNPAGLKLIFAVFNHPEILQLSYRELSKRVGIALGSVGPVIDDLYSSGYIFDDGQRKLVNKKRLFERWVDGYLEKLRPKQIMACYSCDDGDWWKRAEPADFDGLWGGEVTIAKSTPFMVPETVSIYFSSMKKQRDFADYYGLQEDVEGDICMYRSFWSAADELSPMIMYADIVDAINPGSWDVAKTFYGEAIAHLLQD
jgi:hypothetical protein